MRQRADASAALGPYRAKRDFTQTEEPTSGLSRTHSAPIFVVQKHVATRLHFDFRLESGGVLKSWAVPKGPSIDPSVKRLAIAVEDHPLDYATFEGIIPRGAYGGGTVMLWDVGTFAVLPVSPEHRGDMDEALSAGRMRIRLDGVRLQGIWTLVRTRSAGAAVQWLLIRHADAGDTVGEEPVARFQHSVATGRSMQEIAADDVAPR